MYSLSTVTTLSKIIGFGTPSESVGVDFSDDIINGPSGRTFKYFHRLVDLKNIYESVEDPEMPKVDFENYLNQIRFDATKSILAKCLDSTECYDDSIDYDSYIESKYNLFEDAIGYAVAITILELMLSTKRSNLSEINANLTYEKLKLELYGLRSEKGVVVARGLKGELENVIYNIKCIFCPLDQVSINSDPIW